MKAGENITAAKAGHNRSTRLGHWSRPDRRSQLRCTVGLLLVFLGGCATPEPQLDEVPVWQLAQAEPAKLQFIGRTRVSHDLPLPPRVTQRLCDEFSLITISNQTDWANVRRLLRLERAPQTLDFTQGAVVGLLAEVGESATGTWPISLISVRTQSGEGWLTADFAGGFYRPLITAGYLDLVYVPGLHTIRRVEVGPRAFVIRSRTGSH